LPTALTVAGPGGAGGWWRPGCDLLHRRPRSPPLKRRNRIFDHALLSTAGVEGIRWRYSHLIEEVPMARQRHGQIVETATEARQAEPGPSVLALLTVSTGLAVLILGIVWFVFFRT
jgi:hypothetical protein